jgi:hypothetical protein
MIVINQEEVKTSTRPSFASDLTCFPLARRTNIADKMEEESGEQTRQKGATEIKM